MKRQIKFRYILLSLLLLSSFVGAKASSEQVVVTSGRIVYGAFGRVVKTYRLTALSQNGYVSHYWYDADGERDKRTVPMSHYNYNK